MRQRDQASVIVVRPSFSHQQKRSAAERSEHSWCPVPSICDCECSRCQTDFTRSGLPKTAIRASASHSATLLLAWDDPSLIEVEPQTRVSRESPFEAIAEKFR